MHQLKQTQENYQNYTLKDNQISHLTFDDWIIRNILLQFFVSMILTTWETLAEYRLINYLPKESPVFWSFSFCIWCLYSACALLIVLLLALWTLSCVHCLLPPSSSDWQLSTYDPWSVGHTQFEWSMEPHG